MKYKLISEDYYLTFLDKLTRFQPANLRYKSLFDNILNKFYFEPNIKKLTELQKITIATEIINSSSKEHNLDLFFNKLFTTLEDFYFNYDEISYQYLSNRLNIYNILSGINENSILQKNVLWLKNISKQKFNEEDMTDTKSLLYPVKKIILCEGQTEYILLGTIFKLFGIDFDKAGVYIIPAGGKNQVARKYYKMVESYKIPFFVLLDNDATAVRDLITGKLREIDKLYVINSGEFEDLLSIEIVQSTLNYVHKNDYNCTYADFENNLPMVKQIELIYKKYGFGDFKKATFSLYLKEYIEKYCTDKDFINSEIINIVDSFKSL